MRCPMCRHKVIGRSDKKFCSVACKSLYHRKLRDASGIITTGIDKILHRNHEILMEVLGKRKAKEVTNRSELDKRKFNFNYMTGYYLNSQGKRYHYIYNFSYMIFQDDKVMIHRMKKY